MDIKELNKLALGGCPLGSHGWGDVNEYELNDLVRDAIDNGVNFFDTADVYGLGVSEERIGTILSDYRREDYFLATKFGVRIMPQKTLYDNSEDWFWSSLHNSLRRLKTDYIDIYQIHYWDEQTKFEEIFNFFEKAIKQGKIRLMGVTNISRSSLPAEIPNYLKTFSFEYNLIQQKNLDEIMLYENDDIYFLSWGSLCQGLLSGSLCQDTIFGDNDRRSREIYLNFHGSVYKDNLEKVEKLKEISKYLNIPSSRLALAWIIQTIPNSLCLFGATNSKQLLENISPNYYMIEESVIDEISHIFKNV